MSDQLRVEKDGPVTTVILNRPEVRNAVDPDTGRLLAQAFLDFEADDEVTQHQFRIFFRLARHLARSDEIGPAVEQENLEDLAALLGKRPSDWEDADAALEQFVLADDGRHDEELVRLLHRRCWRALKLCGPDGSEIARHNPIPDFRV